MTNTTQQRLHASCTTACALPTAMSPHQPQPIAQNTADSLRQPTTALVSRTLHTAPVPVHRTCTTVAIAQPMLTNPLLPHLKTCLRHKSIRAYCNQACPADCGSCQPAHSLSRRKNSSGHSEPPTQSVDHPATCNRWQVRSIHPCLTPPC